MMHATPLDRMHVLRKLAIHRLVSRSLRGPDGDAVFARAEAALDELAANFGQAKFVRDWYEVMSLGREEVARRIITRELKIMGLRDSSPFMRMWGVGLGYRAEIDLREPRFRKRLSDLGVRMVKLHPDPWVAPLSAIMKSGSG